MSQQRYFQVIFEANTQIQVAQEMWIKFCVKENVVFLRLHKNQIGGRNFPFTLLPHPEKNEVWDESIISTAEICFILWHSIFKALDKFLFDFEASMNKETISSNVRTVVWSFENI